MTETEAKTKWCPLSRVASADALGIVDDNKPSYNRAYVIFDNEGVVPRSCNCIASACMFWRTYRRRDFTVEPVITETGGYCGAAGPVT